MKLSEYIKKYGDVDIEHIKDGVVSIETNGVFSPADGEEYYVLTSVGRIEDQINHFQDITDRNRAVGNCFRTEKEAKSHLERLKVRAELLQAGALEAQNFPEEYELLGYDAVDRELYIENCSKRGDYLYPFSIGFTNREEADKAIEKVGKERIIQAIFGGGE